MTVMDTTNIKIRVKWEDGDSAAVYVVPDPPNEPIQVGLLRANWNDGSWQFSRMKDGDEIVPGIYIEVDPSAEQRFRDQRTEILTATKAKQTPLLKELDGRIEQHCYDNRDTATLGAKVQARQWWYELSGLYPALNGWLSAVDQSVEDEWWVFCSVTCRDEYLRETPKPEEHHWDADSFKTCWVTRKKIEDELPEECEQCGKRLFSDDNPTIRPGDSTDRPDPDVKARRNYRSMTEENLRNAYSELCNGHGVARRRTLDWEADIPLVRKIADEKGIVLT